MFIKNRQVMFPVKLGSRSAKLRVNIVMCDISALFSSITLNYSFC